jgi:hypothetical protein
MLEYFESIRKSDVKAVIVYHPGNSTLMPPVMNDASWGLGDGGAWKTNNNFPTYAIASASGGIIMKELSLYSGNLTDVPQGDSLLELGMDFKPTDYVRLYATITTGQSLNFSSSLSKRNSSVMINLKMLITIQTLGPSFPVSGSFW